MQDSAIGAAAAAASAGMSVSDWVLIVSTLLLALAAFLTPLVGDAIKSHWFAPELVVDARLDQPACHKTRLDLRLSPAQVERHSAYYFRLQVRNSGRTQAKRCEVVIEGIERLTESGSYTPFPRYSPVGVLWGSSYEDFVDINPDRLFYCDFVSIPDGPAQAMLAAMGAYVDPPDASVTGPGLVVAARAAFYSQPNRLPPGKYRFKIAIFSENADTVRRVVPVAWTGQWHEDEETMFNEVSFGPAASAA